MQPEHLDDLLKLRLLFVTGKGGIGKTMVTAGLGQYAASKGLRVLLVESGTRDQLAPLFGIDRVGHNETQVAPGLSCINLNSWENFREYVTKYLKQKMLYDKVFSHKVVQSFLRTVPGLAEVMMLGRLFYTCELAPEPRYDLVIFDGYASGHFLSLMTTPDAVLAAGLGGPLVNETQNVKAFLRNREKCGTVFVAVPEDLVVSESLDFIPQLVERSPSVMRAVLLNRLVQVANPVVPGAAATSDYMAGKAKTHQRALNRFVEGLKDLKSRYDLNLPLLTLPEQGFVTEPMVPQFGASWLAQSRQVEV